MAARNITPPFSFTCLAGFAEGVRPMVDCQPLPDLAVTLPVNTKRIWPKARLWGPTQGTLTGPVLFLDLDLVTPGKPRRRLHPW